MGDFKGKKWEHEIDFNNSKICSLNSSYIISKNKESEVFTTKEGVRQGGRLTIFMQNNHEYS